MFRQLFFTLIFLMPLSALSDDHVKVTDLSWLTGSWDDPNGPCRSRRKLVLPRAGTIVYPFVKPDLRNGYGRDGLHRGNGTLDLYIQQWDTGFKSRTPDAQKMTMSEITENSVTFRSG